MGKHNPKHNTKRINRKRKEREIHEALGPFKSFKKMGQFLERVWSGSLWSDTDRKK